MENEKWYMIVRSLYASVLRPLVIEKVRDTESKIDDVVLNILDRVFNVKIEDDEKV